MHRIAPSSVLEVRATRLRGCGSMGRSASVVVVGLLLLFVARGADAATRPDDRTAIQQAIAEVYRVYSHVRDKQQYRGLLTADYRLLENGELLDAEGDMSVMRSPADRYERTDSFEFKQVNVVGNVGYAVYFLTSAIRDTSSAQTKRWLESAIFRRERGRWRLAVLHSTKTKPA